MVVSKHFITSAKLHSLRIPLLFLLISSWTQLRTVAEGRRTLFRAIGHHKEEKAMVRVLIGSSPPRCERKCRSCRHCEAIQVPMNPGNKNYSSTTKIPFDRGDDDTNYKPMSWKCKCGNVIYNP